MIYKQCFVRFIIPRSADAAVSDAQLVRTVWGGRVAEGFSPTLKFWTWGTSSVGVAVCERNESCHALAAAQLRVFFPWMLISGLILLISSVLLLAIGISKHNLLRDRVGGSYSLAATQFLFWAVLIIGGYIVIYLFTGQVTGVLNASVLGLLGIYTVTSYAATPDAKQLKNLAKSNSKTLNRKANPNISDNFWRDILTDPDFHYIATLDGPPKEGEESDGNHDRIVPQRVVTVIWSIIIALVIVQSILFSFSFPDVDANMLALPGVSSGAYAWTKKLKIRI